MGKHMRHTREYIDQAVNTYRAEVEKSLNDIEHDLRVIEQAVIEIRDGGSQNRAQNIDIALGLIAELIGSLE